MSTRGAYGFRVNETDKLGYNHSDSYPEGLGVDLLKQLVALLAVMPVDSMKEMAAGLQLVSNEGKKPTPAQITKASKLGLVDLNVSDRSTKDWYCVLRHMQGDLAKTLEMGLMENHSNFVHDSLFCEWAYIINLDSRTFEVYKGFNHGKRINGKWVPEHRKGRYAQICSPEDLKKAEETKDSPYFGVWLVKEYPLTALPSEEKFLEEIMAFDK